MPAMMIITTTTPAAMRVRFDPAAVVVELTLLVVAVAVGEVDVVVRLVGGMLELVLTEAVLELEVVCEVAPVAEVEVVTVVLEPPEPPPRFSPQNWSAVWFRPLLSEYVPLTMIS